MTTLEFLGWGIVAVAAFEVVPAILFGAIPTRTRLVRKSSEPERFREMFDAFLSWGLFGVVLAAGLRVATWTQFISAG